MTTQKKMLPKKIDQKKIGYPKKKCYPQKNEKNWLPQKCWRTLLRGGLLLHFGKMAYFIAYGFINAIQTLEKEVAYQETERGKCNEVTTEHNTI